MILLLILNFVLYFQSILCRGYIEQADCNSKLSIDEALIKYQTNNNQNILYATNKECYKCSRTFVSSNEECALLFTPHQFRLYIVNNNTEKVISKRDYTFGEHGIYLIKYDDITNKINIEEEKEPINSLKPLEDLLIVIFLIVFFVFLPSIGKLFFI